MRTLLAWGFGLLALLLTGFGFWFYVYVISPGPGSGTATIFIPRGTGVSEITALLGQEGIIRKDLRFQILARLRGSSNRLRAGEFAIERGLRPSEVLKILEQGMSIQHRITIPEGVTMRWIAALLAEDGWVDTTSFLALGRNPEFIHRFGLSTNSLEGYLFPDTYLFVRGESDAASIITTMINRFLTVWDEVAAKEQLPLNRHQVLTLASIIEKETAAPEERPLIARVFLNRLNKHMRLQSDPTVIYGLLPDFTGNLTRTDLKEETPYNTYVINGLPPGPICSPGRAAIEAVLHPAASKALFFVSRNDGTHVFSRTLNEHNRAVRKYQKN